MTSRSSDIRSSFISKSFTPVNITAPEWRLSGRGMFFMGSCFADYLCSEYRASGLNAMNSPFGNIYNPESMAGAAEMLSADGNSISEEDCFRAAPPADGYRHFMFHSLKSAGSAAELAAGLNSDISRSRKYLETAEAAVLTVGTSLVYRLKSGKTVNNCHKLPSSEFDRIQLGVPKAAASLKKTVEALRTINPELKIILTLSPVRHMRDNAAENSLSKAVLRCAIAQICGGTEEDLPGTWYFPSYEIMLDELRDYRWYAEDLCHPSPAAVSYIIERFREAAYSGEYMEFLEEYSKVLRDLAHKPINPDSRDFLRFRDSALAKKKELERRYPGLLSESLN